MQKTRLMSKSHSKNEEKGEVQFRKNRKFAEIDPHFAHCGRSGRCLRASPAASVDRSIYFHPKSLQHMKQFLLLVLTTLLSLSASAQTRTFTDKLTVELGGKSGTTEPLTATVYLTEHDGKVDLELRNFVFKASSGDPLGVGNIKLSNLPLTDEGEKKSFKGVGKATLTPGNLPGIAFWMASFAKSIDMKAEGYVTADSLNFALDFRVPRMPVAMKVRFGNWAVTGLRTAVNDVQTAAVYTLDGRRLRALPARGGVYIVGGRKVVR